MRCSSLRRLRCLCFRSSSQWRSTMRRIYWSASPLYYATPGWMEWFWNDRIRLVELDLLTRDSTWSRAKWTEFLSYKTGGEYSLFIGLVPLLLLISYLSRRRLRRDLPILFGILLFLLISLGPHLVLVGPVTRADGGFLSLPTVRLFDLPVFSTLNHVSRFGLMVYFFLLLLAAAQKKLCAALSTLP